VAENRAMTTEMALCLETQAILIGRANGMARNQKLYTENPACREWRAGQGSRNLLRGNRCWRWCWSGSAWAAGCGEERGSGGDDEEFGDFHVVVGCWFLITRLICRMTSEK
jgi:hypothetical protein